jgi:SAM-dependent methyltransferase
MESHARQPGDLRSPMPPRQVRHPIFARVYASLGTGMEKAGVGDHRQRLLAGLTGSVLEIGAGNGLNFLHYPPTVTSVVAVEPEPRLRAVVATLMLCSVRDPDVALREMHRVLRPGGELRFMEHVLAESAGCRRIQHFADATCWPVCFGGCHVSRDAVGAITAAGFSVRDLVRYELPDTRIPWPAAPHARGVAIRA